MNATEAVSQPPVVKQSPARVRVALSLLVGAGLLAYVMPRLVGTTLNDISAALGTLNAREVAGLAILWFAGLVTHSYVLTGALPGLSRRRALTLNLTGSAVSNVVPFGGAAGMTLNYRMIRSWRLGRADFAAFTIVTNFWAVVLKLALPAAALGALLLSGTPVTTLTRWTATGAAGALSLLVALMLTGVASRRVAVGAAAIIAPAVVRLGALVGRRVDSSHLAAGILESRDRSADIVRRKWPQLSIGMFGYATLQALLLWACISAVGGRLTPAQALAGFAVDRVLTMAMVTPGGAGITEAGTATTLVALGGAPAVIAAGVLLYRLFTFALEIPVGGIWLGGWLLTRRLSSSSSGDA